jgi:hypothetical protein
MDHTLAALDAQFETLDAHAEGVTNAEAAAAPAGLPDLAPHVRETAIDWPESLPAAPLPQDEDDMDRVIFAALVSPFV